ncbi:MAG: hypothetical protein Kow0037_23690 [Calditrichia bacterium]
MIKSPVEALERIDSLLSELIAWTEKGEICLEQQDWDGFAKVTEDRQAGFNELVALRNYLVNSAKNGTLGLSAEEVNQQLQPKIENLAKVDQKLLDSIKCKKEEVTQAMKLANQGMDFLKKYKQRVVNQNTVVKTL